jgi:hypothetical protein
MDRDMVTIDREDMWADTGIVHMVTDMVMDMDTDGGDDVLLDRPDWRTF